ncbi:TetR/AcrR family transcriptional regulator [Streptomyces sp. MBT56]|uniref:TetR/AcrR family transcriptional regulator n=1 Tax=unclassified Streptomyces TaxID=2593676 RepID=UPI00190CA202|nr:MULTISPECIES: TetR/AcrR family transcriptional regulator [unclassified Streptomyces]MBK3555581.1 TetR/AcrR family transcriptional regulator [Streptomyces sp. MBT56]MBK3606767.1 TetR/AcrR family transcriptional regulator [Streptomyces sp. MBT54]MBK3618768.1 TetR/AcrR family transcriptional regulator [Streptomyces sp. MBT98]MBK6044006.1 TetR/AcrR family transcriptional regulator [Streptomyces sp. MBT55]
MAPTKAPDSSRRSDRSRRAIHDAALALVTEVGYRSTTIEGIAARAGVGKQTIYRWWPSKAAVLMDAFLDLAGRSAEGAGSGGEAQSDEAAQGIPDTGDLVADLKLVLRATVDELNDPVLEAPTRALTAEGIVDAKLGAEFVHKLLDPQLALYVTRLRAAQEAGDVRADVDPRIALELLIGPLMHRWLLRTLPLTHAYADEIVDYAVGGLAPRP